MSLVVYTLGGANKARLAFAFWMVCRKFEPNLRLFLRGDLQIRL